MDFLVESDDLTGKRNHHKTLSVPRAFKEIKNGTELTDKEAELTTVVMNLN